MPLITIDLVDGHSPVEFTLKGSDAVRFDNFMSKYTVLQNAVNAAHKRLDDMVSAGEIPMPDRLRATALGQCTESLLEELAPHVDWE